MVNVASERYQVTDREGVDILLLGETKVDVGAADTQIQEEVVQWVDRSGVLQRRCYRLVWPSQHVRRRETGRGNAASGGVMFAVRSDWLREVECVEVLDLEVLADPSGIRHGSLNNILALRLAQGRVDAAGAPVRDTLLVGVYLQPERGGQPSHRNRGVLQIFQRLVARELDCDVVVAGDLNYDAVGRRPSLFPAAARRNFEFICRGGEEELVNLIHLHGDPQVDASMIAAGTGDNLLVPAPTRPLGNYGGPDGSIIDYFLVPFSLRADYNEVDDPEELGPVGGPSRRALRAWTIPTAELASSDHNTLILSWYTGNQPGILHENVECDRRSESQSSGARQSGTIPCPRAFRFKTLRPGALDGSDAGSKGTTTCLQWELEHHMREFQSFAQAVFRRMASTQGRMELEVRQELVDKGNMLFSLALIRAWEAASEGYPELGGTPARRSGPQSVEDMITNPEIQQAKAREEALRVRLLETRKKWELVRRQNRLAAYALGRTCQELQRALARASKEVARLLRSAARRRVAKDLADWEMSGSPGKARQAWELLKGCTEVHVEPQQHRVPDLPSLDDFVQFYQGWENTDGRLVNHPLAQAAVWDARCSPIHDSLHTKEEVLWQRVTEASQQWKLELAARCPAPEISDAFQQDEISEEEVLVALRKTKPFKSVGKDGIGGYLLKAGGVVAAKYLCTFFNLCWLTGTIPRGWSEGILVPIPKPKGDPQQPASYRPITLMPVISKVYERVVEGRLRPIDKHLHPCQLGFRKGKGCADALFQVLSILEMRKSVKLKDCKERAHTYIASLDIEKAYDSVWHDGLLYKLRRYGVTGRVWASLAAMYRQPSRQVRLGNQLSAPFEVKRGLMQGSILSPLLFNVMMAELAHVVYGSERIWSMGVLSQWTVSTEPPSPGNDTMRRCPMLIYADDIILLSPPIPLALWRLVSVVEAYGARWQFRFSASKSVVMAVGGSDVLVPDENTTAGPLLQHSKLRWVQSVRYLGVDITNQGDTSKSRDDRINRAERAEGIVRSRLFQGILPIGLRTLNMVIHPLVLSLGTYGAQALVLSESQVYRLEVIRNRLLRSLFGIEQKGSFIPNILLQGESGWESLQSYLDRLLVTFASKNIAQLSSEPDSIQGGLMKQLLCDSAWEQHSWRRGLEGALSRYSQTLDSFLRLEGRLHWPSGAGSPGPQPPVGYERRDKLQTLMKTYEQERWRKAVEDKTKKASLGGLLSAYFASSKIHAWEYRMSSAMMFSALDPRIPRYLFRARCGALRTLWYLRARALKMPSPAFLFDRSWPRNKLGDECLFCAALGGGPPVWDDTPHLLSGSCVLLRDLFQPFSRFLLKELCATYSNRIPKDWTPGQQEVLRRPLMDDWIALPELAGACAGRHMHRVLRLAFQGQFGPQGFAKMVLRGDSQDPFLPWICPRRKSHRVLAQWKKAVFKLPDILSQTLVTKLIIPALQRRDMALREWISSGNLTSLRVSHLSAQQKQWLLDYVQATWPMALQGPAVF